MNIQPSVAPLFLAKGIFAICVWKYCVFDIPVSGDRDESSTITVTGMACIEPSAG